MTVNELLDTGLRYLMCGAIGYLLGSITMYRRARVHGISVIVPHVPRTARTFTALVLVLSVVTAFTVVSGQLEARHTRACNDAFRTALRINSRINTEDRELEKRDDALRERRDDAMDDLIKGLMAVGSAAPESVLGLLARYDDTVRVIGAERTDLDRARAGLEQQRRDNPYPEPRCD